MPVEQAAEKTAETSVWQELRNQTLIWLGIAGGAITLISHQTEFLKLAGFARQLVDNFSAIMHQFWNIIGSYIHVTIPPDLSAFLTFFSFYVSLTVGTILSAGEMRKLKRMRVGIFKLSGTVLIGLAGGAYAYMHGVPIHHSIFLTIVLALLVYTTSHLGFGGTVAELMVGMLILIVLFISLPLFTSALRFALKFFPKIYAVPLAALMTAIVICLPMLLPPPKPLAKKLAFMLIGVALIFGLSEVSKQVEKLQITPATVQTH